MDPVAVKEAQSILVRWRAVHGHGSRWPEDFGPRDVDGKIGPRTRAVLAHFQAAWNASRSLNERGELDAPTLGALRLEGLELARVDAYGWRVEDYRALVAGAGELVARPADLHLVLYSESRLKASAAFMDKGFPVAVGLNQITPTNARAMGITEAERRAILQLSPAEQMPLVVRSFHAAGGRREYSDAGALYQANFAPATLRQGSADAVVLYRREQGDVYALNAGLDFNRDGAITVGDLRAHLARIASSSHYLAALEAFRTAVGAELTDPAHGG